MTDPVYDFNVYPASGTNPVTANADPERANVGICFSGGGSRALTCAWGQMTGLRNLRDASGVSLLDRVRYVSSVSGGSWAAVPWTFLPDAVAEERFFTPCYAPEDLYLGPATGAGLDVTVMDGQALGVVPQRFANLVEPDPFRNIIAGFVLIVLVRGLGLRDSLKWLWLHIVGENVLAPFGLHDFRFSIHGEGTPWQNPDARFFSLSADYVQHQILDKLRHPDIGTFDLVRAEGSGAPARPMLIVNTNIVGSPCPDGQMTGPLQVPVQIAPVSGGWFGSNPCRAGADEGGGGTESLGFTSVLRSGGPGESVSAGFPRVFGLVDIATCSSAFYSAMLVANIRGVLSGMLAERDEHLEALAARLMVEGEALLPGDFRRRLADLHEEAGSIQLSDLVPEYNLWTVASVPEGSRANRETRFTDGGDLENTGVLGMLAQTDADTLIVFVNTSTELRMSDGVIVAATQAAPLYGVAYDSASNTFLPYGDNGLNPFSGMTDPKGFLQVFDNTADEFSALREGLYRANGSGAQSGPAFFLQSLRVLDNRLGGVKARPDPIRVLWVQNARVENWQSRIGDAALREAIKTGQSIGGFSQFADFPYYDTFRKIHQTAAETNTLAQMWAWCVSDEASPLSSILRRLF